MHTTVEAGFTRRHTPQPFVDLSTVTLDHPSIVEAWERVTKARAAVIAAQQECEGVTKPQPGRRRATYDDVDYQYGLREQATADLERAVRAVNPGATEAAIQTATRSL